MAPKTLVTKDGAIEISWVNFIRLAPGPQNESAELKKVLDMLTDPANWAIPSGGQRFEDARPEIPGHFGRQEGPDWVINIDSTERLTLSHFRLNAPGVPDNRRGIFVNAGVSHVPVPTIVRQIEHVVLLMLENRSLDSLLGWLYEKKNPAKNIPPLKGGERAYEGLQGINLNDYENVDASGTIKALPIRGARGLNAPNVHPGEEFAHVTTQLFDYTREMTVHGVLLAGKWKTERELWEMRKTTSFDRYLRAQGAVAGPLAQVAGTLAPPPRSGEFEKIVSEDQRNLLLAILPGYIKDFKSFLDKGQTVPSNFGGLEGVGAVVAFLLGAGLRTREELKDMTYEQQRNYLITYLIAKNKEHAHVPESQLQGLSNQALVLMGWEWSAKPTMKGYVHDYADYLCKYDYTDAQIQRYGDQVMQSYTPDQLPVLNGLAEHYAVCDMWFSSVPSQTNPNRAFAFCGTSMGLVNNGFLEEDPRRKPVEDWVGYLLGDDRFHAKTILKALQDDGKTTWKVFRESGMLQNNVLKAVDHLNKADPLNTHTLSAESRAYLRELSSEAVSSDYTYRVFPDLKGLESHFATGANLDDFYSAARAGKLDNFTFIQPEWTIGERGTGGNYRSLLFHQGDDYHPPGNLDAGENLVKKVYESLIANRTAWEKTLLIITFDEPVGAFDHVPPPAAIPPWTEDRVQRYQDGSLRVLDAPVPPHSYPKAGTATQDKQAGGFVLQENFEFKRYGGRVPTILVSPWVEKGTVFRSATNVPFDHTSLIATILKWRGLENLIHRGEFGERTKQAPTFDHVLSAGAPRADEQDVRFLKLSRSNGAPVHFYDRFYLKDPSGACISKFQEKLVNWLIPFYEDPTFSEYFPSLGGTKTPFYLQNAKNRPDPGEIQLPIEIKLIASEDGLGSYNVLGAWSDDLQLYYFNDYMEGEAYAAYQTWTISKTDGQPGPLRFGDQVTFQNKAFSQPLASLGQALTTKGGHLDTFVKVITFGTKEVSGTTSWTVVPIPPPLPEEFANTPAPLHGFQAGRMDVFWRAPNGSLQQAEVWEGNVGKSFQLTNGPMASAPAPVSGFQAGRMDVFWRAPNGSLWDTTWDGIRWSDREITARTMASAPAPLSGFSANRMDVFWRAPNGSLWDTAWEGVKWTDWELSKGPMASPPAPLVCPGRVDVFWRHTDGSLWNTVLQNGRWTTWGQLGGPMAMASPPAPLYGIEAGRIDVFWRALDGSLWNTVLQNGAWTAWPLNSGPMASPPAPLYGFKAGRMDVFWMAPDRSLWDTKWDGQVWTHTQISKGPMASPPAPLCGKAGQMDVFWKAPDGSLWDTWCDGSVWADKEIYRFPI